MKKLGFTVLTMSALTLFAGTPSYRISVLQKSTVDGQQLDSGDYKVQMENDKTAVLKHGKEAIRVSAQEENENHKFQTTELEFSNDNQLQEIHVGGTSTKIVFATHTGVAGGQ